MLENKAIINYAKGDILEREKFHCNAFFEVNKTNKVEGVAPLAVMISGNN